MALPTIDRARLERQGWSRVTDSAVPSGAECATCGYPGLDEPDENDTVSAVLAPDGEPYCGWSCALSAARTARFRAARLDRIAGTAHGLACPICPIDDDGRPACLPED